MVGITPADPHNVLVEYLVLERLVRTRHPLVARSEHSKYTPHRYTVVTS